MVYYVGFVTVLFLVRFNFGLNRLNRQPKTIKYYDHKADMVEMILNMVIAVVGLCLLINTAFKPL